MTDNKLTNAQIAATAGRLGGFSETRSLGQQWDNVYELVRKVIAERAALAKQDALAMPDIGELYAQGWINGGQVQSLIDWCSSYCKKHPSVAFTEGTTRQLAYAIFAALLFYQSEELKFAVNRLKQLVGLVYRGDYSNTETKEWWSQVEEILKDTQAFCALPGEHIQKCAPNTAAPTPPAQEKQS